MVDKTFIGSQGVNVFVVPSGVGCASAGGGGSAVAAGADSQGVPGASEQAAQHVSPHRTPMPLHLHHQRPLNHIHVNTTLYH